MTFVWLIACFTLVGLALVQAALMLLQTWEHCRYARRAMRDLDRHRPQGRATVFVPCKGVDAELEDNLRAILRQDYGDYEVVFIVEDREDAAYPVVLRVVSEPRSCGARVIIAGRSNSSGQKVHNLVVATGYLDADVCYLAFMDSDARPRRAWLRMLLSRLDRDEVGAATGYRWFVCQRATLAHWLLSAINCRVMSLMGRFSHGLVWGGSWAVRRNVFDALGVRQAWQGTLSDDLVASQLLRQAKLKTRFEPAAIVASPLDTTTARGFGFMRRQYLISRFYVPLWWSLGLAVATLNVLMLAAFAALLLQSGVRGAPPLWIPLSLAGVVYGLNAARGFVRQSLVRSYFPELAARMAAASWFDVFAGPLVVLVNWAGMASSAFGSVVRWRGKCYRLLPHGKVRKLSSEPRPALAQPQVVLHFRLERRPSAARRRVSPGQQGVERPMSTPARINIPETLAE